MRSTLWITLYISCSIISVLSYPSVTESTSNVKKRADLDHQHQQPLELESSAATNHHQQHHNHHSGPIKDPENDLQASAGGIPPIVFAIPQLSLLLSLLQLLLEVIYKSPQFAQFIHFASHQQHHLLQNPALLHHGGAGVGKVGAAGPLSFPPPIPHNNGLGLYGNGLYGVSASTSLAKGRPFGPYKYEDNQ